MNAPMAPLEKEQRLSVGDSTRSNGPMIKVLLKRQDSGNGDGGDGSRRPHFGFGGGRFGKGHDGRGGFGRFGPGGGGGAGDDKVEDSLSSQGPPSEAPTELAATASIPATPISGPPIPNSAPPANTSATARPPPSQPPPISSASSLTASTGIPSSPLSPLETSMPATALPSMSVMTTTMTASPTSSASDDSSQARKGLNDSSSILTTGLSSQDPVAVMTMTETLMVTPPLSVVQSTSTSSERPRFTGFPPGAKPFRDRADRNGNGLSPTSERILIAVGAIGAFIIVLAGIFLMMRMKGIHVFGGAKNGRVRKGRSRGWRRNSKTPSEDPPQYYGNSDYGYPADEKKIQGGKKAELNFPPTISPAMLPPLAIPETTTTSVRVESPNSSVPLTRNMSPFGAYSPHDSPIADLQASYNNTGRRNTMLSRQVPETINTGTSQSVQTNQAAFFIHDPSNSQFNNQPQTNRMSYMSSLSSGFGDGLVPDPNNPNAVMQGYRQSRTNGTFSWMQLPAQRRGDRDTIDTTASVESAPRFRTINSWVAQQASRVPVGAVPGQDVPSVPAIPTQLRQQPAQYYTPSVHQRNPSENPVFQFHPGDEVQISRGSRVPSEILNRKIGIN